MIVVLFFSRLTAEAGEEYVATDQRLMEKARSAPGFVDAPRLARGSRAPGGAGEGAGAVVSVLRHGNRGGHS